MDEAQYNKSSRNAPFIQQSLKVTATISAIDELLP